MHNVTVKVTAVTLFVGHSPIFANILKLKSRLSEIIEPDFGLLDYLLHLEVLTRKQYEDVRSEKGAAYRRSEAVLDLLKTDDHCDKFLKALQLTGQQHVFNYITANGGEKINSQFLADRTNGRAIGTVLRLSVCLSSVCDVMYCVLEQKLLLRAYRKSYMRNRLVPK